MNRLVMLALLALGCGAPSSPVRTASSEVAPEAMATDERATSDAAGEASEPPPQMDPPRTVEELRAELEPVRPVLWPPLRDAFRSCRPPRVLSERAIDAWHEHCEIGSVAGWDASAGRWLILELDRSEAEIERARLVAASPEGDEVRVSGEWSPMLASEMLPRIEHVHAPVVSIVRARALESFSIVEYATLVELAEPLAGWHLHLATNRDLDRPEHVLALIDPSGRRIELARRTAELGPCDGDGYFCEAREDECTPAELRAEGRLCVQPLGIDDVAVRDGTLLVMGTGARAGHGGAPAFHWVARLP